MRKLSPKDLPQEALDAISEEQKSYLDEFEFIQLAEDNRIEAWYAGDLLACWDGEGWTYPKDFTWSKPYPIRSR